MSAKHAETSVPSRGALPSPRDSSKPYRVCLVCLGNICRSPMAQTVLRAELDRAGLANAVEVDSAGTGDWHIGAPMNRGAQTALASRGYDGRGHQARQIQPSWLQDRDLILAMDASNLADLREMAAHATGAADEGKERRILLFGQVGGLTAAGDGAQIPDPYGEDAATFGRVLDLLESAAPIIISQLAELVER